MNTLIAIVFKHDENGAEKALQKMRSMEKEYLLDLDDAVIVTRRKDGKVKLTQSVNLTATGAWEGAFWGLLIGFLFTGPMGLLLTAGIGAGFGALAGSLSDYGIDEDFIEDLSEKVEPCCSALFILVRQMTVDKVIDELEGLGGTIIKTSLSKDVEAKLQAALTRHKKAAA